MLRLNNFRGYTDLYHLDICVSLYADMLKIYPATRLSSFVFLCPVFGVILGGLFLKEGFELKIMPPSPWSPQGLKSLIHHRLSIKSCIGNY